MRISFDLFIIINNENFRSRRRGFQRYIVGQLRECASRFYHEDVCVRVYDDISTNECKREFYFEKQTNKYVLSGTLIIFRVDFNNSTVKETSKRLHAIPLLPDITSDTFFKVFPFCILIDPTMRITHTGKSIKNLFPADTILTGRYLDEIFRLIRPDIALEWSKVNSICLCSFDLK